MELLFLSAAFFITSREPFKRLYISIKTIHSLSIKIPQKYSLKKVKIISSIGIFLLCFLFHFIYEWIPNTVTSIFFPVNESIWEHMKLLFSSVIFYGIIDYLILQKFYIKYKNFFTSLFMSALLIIPIYLIMFLPVYYKIGNRMIITILLMFLSIILSQVISYYILKDRYYYRSSLLSLIYIPNIVLQICLPVSVLKIFSCYSP